jgi:alpha-glucuronidase
MERTTAGTGYAGQYPANLAARYNSLAQTPDDLLLFFHHVPYNYLLHSGKTLIQSIYDTHYLSAKQAGEYVPRWMALKGRIDADRYQQVLDLFTFQAGHALVWRDAIDVWFLRMSKIPDAEGRVGHHADRIEAEQMTTTGYETVDVNPAETASNGKAVVCRKESGCTLSAILSQPSGTYDIAVGYFDTWRGASKYHLLVNGKSIAAWSADDTLPPAQFDSHLDGQTATRYTVHGVHLKPGDQLTLQGTPDLRPELNATVKEATEPGAIIARPSVQRDYREFAPVDYLQIGPAGPLTPQN